MPSPNMSSPSRCILVVGTGRSGTSAVAGVLHHLGVTMGAEFVPPDKTNPYGMFEDAGLFNLAREVLHDDKPIRAFLPEVRNREQGPQPWGWKDPALVWLLPDILGMISNPRIILIKRPAEECIQSFADSYPGGRERAESWHTSITERLDSLIWSVPTLEIQFHDLLDNPGAVVSQIAAFAFEGLEPPTPAQVEMATKHIRPKGAKHRARILPIIGIPLERSISHASRVIPWIATIAQKGYAFAFLPYGRTDVTRNRFAVHLLENPKFTHLVMLDLDHEHPPDIVERLCQRVAEDPTRQVVSALAFRRGEPFDPIAYRFDEEDPEQLYSVSEWQPGEVLEVDRLGFGAVIIERSVFDVLPKPWFRYTYEKEDSYPTEDVWFSQSCLDHGVKLWVDTGTVTDHLITSMVNERVFRGYLAQKAAVEEANHAGSKGT